MKGGAGSKGRMPPPAHIFYVFYVKQRNHLAKQDYQARAIIIINKNYTLGLLKHNTANLSHINAKEDNDKFKFTTE